MSYTFLIFTTHLYLNVSSWRTERLRNFPKVTEPF